MTSANHAVRDATPKQSFPDNLPLLLRSLMNGRSLYINNIEWRYNISCDQLEMQYEGIWQAIKGDPIATIFTLSQHLSLSLVNWLRANHTLEIKTSNLPSGYSIIMKALMYGFIITVNGEEYRFAQKDQPLYYAKDPRKENVDDTLMVARECGLFTRYGRGWILPIGRRTLPEIRRIALSAKKEELLFIRQQIAFDDAIRQTKL
ncbi:hypothetical protein AB6D11_00145 [Vibrio splendidus]